MDSLPRFFSILFTAAACFFFLSALIRLAPKVGLVDRPSKRKSHVGLVPTVGGISIYLGVCFSAFVFNFSVGEILPFYIGSALVLLGALDDRLDLSARLRLPFQLGIVYVMVHFCGLEIFSVGNILGFGAVNVSYPFSVLFTLLCAVGVINSINMIDGVDGLSGSLLLITLLPLTALAGVGAESELFLLLLNLICGVLVFLFFNSRLFRGNAAVFLGDAGSMFMGLVLVWCFIQLSQGGGAVLSPVAAGWLFGLPLADTVSVMVRRIVKGHSPFAADRTHLHYKFMDAGFSVNQTVFLMAALHLCFVAVGLLGNVYRTYEPVLFTSFVAIVLVHFFFTDWAINKLASGYTKRQQSHL